MNQRRGLVLLIVVMLGLGLYVYVRQNSTPGFIEQPKTVEQAAPVIAPQAPASPTPPPGADVVPPASSATATAVAATTTPAREKFQKLMADVKKQIPKRAALQKLTAEEAHFTPPSVQQAALGMGQIAQAIADDPSLIPEGVKFYRECAEDDTSPNSIRASCVAEHESLTKKAGLKEEKSLNDDPAVNERIKKLAGSLGTK